MNKLHRNKDFTNYYFTVPDTTGKKGTTFIGQKKSKWSWDVGQKLNKMFTEIEIYGDKKPFITKDESHQLEYLLDEIDSEDIRLLIGKEKLVKHIDNIDQTESEFDGWRFIYRTNSEIVGAVQGVVMPDGTNVLSNIYVKPEYRRQGIGKKLVEIAKQEKPKLKISSDFTDMGFKHFQSIRGTS